MLADTAGRFPDREAVCVPRPRHPLELAEFAEKVERIAAGFVALGLRKGDRIGIWSQNRPEWVLTQFASARAGLILTTINPAYRVTELEYV